MSATSAALCLYRVVDIDRPEDSSVTAQLELLIGHPGGPFWKNKDEGAWSLPKGEFDPDIESTISAAKREFEEELGSAPPSGPMIDLGETRLKSGKIIYACAVEGDLDAKSIVSNSFEIEWPPRSGKQASFPEIDRARWCGPDEAKSLLNPAQAVFVDRLIALVAI